MVLVKFKPSELLWQTVVRQDVPFGGGCDRGREACPVIGLCIKPWRELRDLGAFVVALLDIPVTAVVSVYRGEGAAGSCCELQLSGVLWVRSLGNMQLLSVKAHGCPCVYSVITKVDSLGHPVSLWMSTTSRRMAVVQLPGQRAPSSTPSSTPPRCCLGNCTLPCLSGRCLTQVAAEGRPAICCVSSLPSSCPWKQVPLEGLAEVQGLGGPRDSAPGCLLSSHQC